MQTMTMNNHIAPAALERMIQRHLIIENKQARRVRFQPNRIQRLYNHQRTNRDIILKARQFGFTSWILGEFAIKSAKIHNLRSVVVAHDKESTQRMLQKVKKYFQRFVINEYIQPITLTTESKNEIVVEETGSTIYIGTAGSRTFGRGDTVHNLLLSEAAKYDNPDEIFAGIVQSVPIDGRVVIETTANGYNFLRKLYYDAKRGVSNYQAHFFPWFWHDEYRLPGPPLERTAEEIELCRQFPEIIDDQLRWRRWKKTEPGFVKNPLLFNQEYPSTDHEAFIASGNTVFNTQAVDNMLKTAKPPIFKGNVDVSGQVSDDSRGFLWIWKFPDLRKTYVSFFDPAEGLGKGDFAAGVVMEYDTAEVVAVWHGHIDPDQLGRQAVGVARYYKEALLGIEVENHGHTTIVAARDTGYENLYRRVTYDEQTEQETQKLGWSTNLVTKPIMIGELKGVVRQRQIVIPDERILLQLMAYEEKEPASEDSIHRKLGAPSGEHDDLVIATAGAFQMRKYSAPVEYETNVPTNYLEHARKQQQHQPRAGT